MKWMARRPLPSHLSARASLALAFAAIGLAATVWGFQTWRVVPLLPACEIKEARVGDYISEFRFIFDQPSAEFRAMAAETITDYQHWVLTDPDDVAVADGRVYLTPISYFVLDVPGRSTPDQRKLWFHWVASTIAAEILEKRKAEGRFTDADQKDFMIFRDRWNMHYPMEPGECGFMEELIMKGGRFASD